MAAAQGAGHDTEAIHALPVGQKVTNSGLVVIRLRAGGSLIKAGIAAGQCWGRMHAVHRVLCCSCTVAFTTAQAHQARGNAA
jgi:hypothetical protein